MATIFTKIIEGEISCHKVAETEQHIAFLDINPIARGHTLIVSKQEIDYFFDLPDELYHSTMDFARTVSGAIDRALAPLRTGIIVQGLEVPHAHLHLIPLYKTHQVMALGHNVDVTEEEMKELAQKISDEVSA
ncbi:HIT family protein [Aliifodinibius sp. S!AR15-10]|uniref:HIT family protein n=1 Tax=Aliifodinibius sp. S!AR15-10 TaxID=2950437 RepID=UPI0028624260|nr:HIT family protein [Aliifodinibius sp. S!AR15-10]MDR8392452.1 HIT family protein [Aliifodinibius sp. S!AR15-10]